MGTKISNLLVPNVLYWIKLSDWNYCIQIATKTEGQDTKPVMLHNFPGLKTCLYMQKKEFIVSLLA